MRPKAVPHERAERHLFARPQHARLYSATRSDKGTYARIKDAEFRWAPKQDLLVAPEWMPARNLALISATAFLVVHRAPPRPHGYHQDTDCFLRDFAGQMAAGVTRVGPCVFRPLIITGSNST